MIYSSHAEKQPEINQHILLFWIVVDTQKAVPKTQAICKYFVNDIIWIFNWMFTSDLVSIAMNRLIRWFMMNHCVFVPHFHLVWTVKIAIHLRVAFVIEKHKLSNYLF